jgi:hypothetical protein
MTHVEPIGVAIGPLNETGPGVPGPWVSCSFVAQGFAPQGRRWANITTNGGAQFCLSPDLGVTVYGLETVATSLSARVPVPEGYGLLVRHPSGGGVNRYALVSWSPR